MSLEARLQRQEQLEALHRLKHENYCLAVDRAVCQRDPKAFAPLVERLHDDIAISFTGIGSMQGKAAASAFFTEGVYGMLSWCQHRVSNPVIDLDGDDAHGQWYVFCPAVATDAAPTGAGAIVILGRYEERYRRIDGRWYWTELHARLDVLSPADALWGGAAWAG